MLYRSLKYFALCLAASLSLQNLAEAQIGTTQYYPNFIADLYDGIFPYTEYISGSSLEEKYARVDIWMVYSGFAGCRLIDTDIERASSAEIMTFVVNGETDTMGMLELSKAINLNYLAAVTAATSCNTPETQRAKATLETGIKTLIDRTEQIRRRSISGTLPLADNEVVGVTSRLQFREYSDRAPSSEIDLFDKDIRVMRDAGTELLQCRYGPINPLDSYSYRTFQFWYRKVPPNLSTVQNYGTSHPAFNLGTAAVECCPEAENWVEAARSGSNVPRCEGQVITRREYPLNQSYPETPCDLMPPYWEEKVDGVIDLLGDVSNEGQVTNVRLYRITGNFPDQYRDAFVELALSNAKELTFSPRVENDIPVVAKDVKIHVRFDPNQEDYKRCGKFEKPINFLGTRTLRNGAIICDYDDNKMVMVSEPSQCPQDYNRYRTCTMAGGAAEVGLRTKSCLPGGATASE